MLMVRGALVEEREMGYDWGNFILRETDRQKERDKKEKIREKIIKSSPCFASIGWVGLILISTLRDRAATSQQMIGRERSCV